MITSLLRHYYFIITKRKSCNNDCIITCYANGMPPLSRHYYTLLRQFYTDLCYYSYYTFQSPELADVAAQRAQRISSCYD